VLRQSTVDQSDDRASLHQRHSSSWSVYLAPSALASSHVKTKNGLTFLVRLAQLVLDIEASTPAFVLFVCFTMRSFLVSQKDCPGCFSARCNHDAITWLPGWGEVLRSACLYVCALAYLGNCTSQLREIFCTCARGHGSVCL